MLPENSNNNSNAMSPTAKLAANVRALSRATMAAMESGKEHNNEEVDSDDDDDTDSEWSNLVVSAIAKDNWVGSNVKTGIGASCNVILDAFVRELGQFMVDQELLEASPRMSVGVTGVSGGIILEEAWRREKLRFKFLVNGRSLSEMPIYLDPKEEEETKVEVWVYKKKAPPKEDKLLGVASSADRTMIGKIFKSLLYIYLLKHFIYFALQVKKLLSYL